MGCARGPGRDARSAARGPERDPALSGPIKYCAHVNTLVKFSALGSAASAASVFPLDRRERENGRECGRKLKFDGSRLPRGRMRAVRFRQCRVAVWLAFLVSGSGILARLAQRYSGDTGRVGFLIH